jgi:hypothetical protein
MVSHPIEFPLDLPDRHVGIGLTPVLRENACAGQSSDKEDEMT